MNLTRAALVIGALLLALPACGQARHADRSPLPQGPLPQVRSWAIQLQGLERDGALDRLEQARVDLLVLEPVDTVRGMTGFPTRAMVARVHASRGDHRDRKLCLAYLNVGQAEDYRTYWQPDWRAPTAAGPGEPPFLLALDPDGWAGNYPVAFWTPQWRKVLFGQPDALLDRILAQGFDGVYLDWVLGHCHPQVEAAAAKAGVDPSTAMVTLLRDLRVYARARAPGFLLIAQNGIELLERRPDLAAVVDAISQEDLSFRGTAGAGWEDPNGGDIPAAAAGSWSTAGLARRLRAARAAGLPVFTLDYALQPPNVARALAESRAHGFVPCVSRVALDRLP